MKKYFIFLMVIFPFILTAQTVKKDSLLLNESQFNITGGMGICAVSISDFVDYINYYVPSGYDKYKGIATAPEFYLNCEYRFSDKYGLKFEYNYIVKSYNIDNPMYSMNLSYYIHSPALIFNYIIRDKGYLLKFGGGLNYNFAHLYHEGAFGLSKDDYYASGIGAKIDAYGHTQLGSNIYMVLALNLRAGFLGDLKNDDDVYLSPNQKVNMSYFSAGLSFGLAYYF